MPTTIREQQVTYIADAVAIARRTERFPFDSRFRWTCEVLLPVADFLAQATPVERRGFNRAFANGQIEFGALPAVMSGLMWKEKISAAQESLKPIIKKYRPKVAFQNDVALMRKEDSRWCGSDESPSLCPDHRCAFWQINSQAHESFSQ
ncbi:MAG: hypothetical protein ACOYMS_05905 [Terrimicrobiaceae bacterium]